MLTKGNLLILFPGYGTKHLVDLSKIDFKKLKERFKKSRKRIIAERLRGILNSKLKRLVRLNRTRIDFYEKFQQMIDEYNSGAHNVEKFFNNLMNFAKELDKEEKRVIAEQLSEEELAIFDLLIKPDTKLSKKEKTQIKKVARELLEMLKKGKLVLDWRKRQQSRASVLVTIQDLLDRGLPESFLPEIYKEKCQSIYQHVYESYYGQDRSIYTAAA